MKRCSAILSLAVCTALITLTGCKDQASGTAGGAGIGQAELSTEQQRMGYSLGASVGQQFRGDQLDIDADALARGVRDGFNGTLAMSDADIMQGVQQLQQSHAERMQAEFTRQAETNAAEGARFLQENGAREGVTTTASGLQYRILTAGDGQKPGVDDTVKVHYVGTLIDGTEFDSSVRRGEPVTFPLRSVIPGWVEALQLMPVGSKWELVIPSELAYGPGGAGGQIGPNAVLRFEVELLGIEKPESDNAAE